MARSAEKSVAYTLFFSFRNYCVSGTKTKTHPDYTEVKQEDSIDDVVEEKPDLKKSKGKIQSAFSAKSVVTSCCERYCM